MQHYQMSLDFSSPWILSDC